MNTLSIIIPALNESECIEQTIHAVRERSELSVPKQIIVVDGGSTDNTVELAKCSGAECAVIPNAPRGRAYLLNRGVHHATGEVLLFLDADTIVPQGYDKEIEESFWKSGVVGGAFEFALDGPQFGLRVVELINRTRYRIWQRYYGDQGIFVKKDVFHKIGGYPQVGLMEASDFCVNLSREGKLKLVQKPMLTSARRFIDNGIYRVLGFDIRMWWLNLIKQDTEKFAQAYWNVNRS